MHSISALQIQRKRFHGQAVPAVDAGFSAVSIVPRRFWGSTCRDGSRRCGYTYPTRFYLPLAGSKGGSSRLRHARRSHRDKTGRRKHLRHRVKTATPSLAAERMTARNSRDCHSGPAQPAIAGHRDRRIVRTRRLKTASAGHRQQRAGQSMQAGRNPTMIEAGQPLHPRRAPLLTSCHGSSLRG